MFQQLADGSLGDAEEGPVKRLQHIDEDRPMAAILGHQEMRRLVQHQEAKEAALLYDDAMALDVGEAADPRILEAGYEIETRRRPSEGGEDVADQRRRLARRYDAMAIGILGEELVLPTAQRGAEVLLRPALRESGDDAFVENRAGEATKPC